VVTKPDYPKSDNAGGEMPEKDAVDFIIEDHQVMRAAFDELNQATVDARPQLLKNVAAMLRAHSHAEERHVYPALLVADEDEKEDVHHGAEEHHEAEALLNQLEACPVDSGEFETLLDEFTEAVLHHMDEEESEILPGLRRTVDEKTLVDLGLAFEEQRLAELEESTRA
jgi:hemerythrin superfamily protein